MKATPALSGPAIVGKFYMVPCIAVDKQYASFFDSEPGCFVPTLGPKHIDAEHINFPHEHWHIDWRFVSAETHRAATGGRSPLSRVLTSDSGHLVLTRSPELRRLKCKRPMPTFPSMLGARTQYGEQFGVKWGHMELAQAFVCNKLKPGNICPHRGIDLTPFIKDDGTVICPGHGLKWDTKTGDLLPHHARVA